MSSSMIENQKADKPAVAKEKKTKQTKPKATTKTSSHPPYFEMIKEALLALKERSGSSPYAISKYMEEKHKSVLPENFRKYLGLQLKNSAAKGKLIKIKASYKLSESGKKEKPFVVAKKPKAAAEAKKPITTKKQPKAAVESKAKKPATKRKAEAVTKKKVSTPMKKPKSIKKSPAAKKVKKAA